VLYHFIVPFIMVFSSLFISEFVTNELKQNVSTVYL
jgi:hypothetical protein